MNIYVGNLANEVTEDQLKEAFGAFGSVESANLVKDRYSGESRGFGFVLMPVKDEAEKAIAEMNGKDFNGRALKVQESQPRPNRDGRRGGSGGFGGSGGRPGGFKGRGRPGGFGNDSRGGGGGGGGGSRRRY